MVDAASSQTIPEVAATTRPAVIRAVWARLVWIFDTFERVCMWGAMLCAAFMMVAVSADTTLRYLFSAPIPGVKEIIQEYLLPALGYLAMSYTYKTNGHVRVTVLVRYLPRSVRIVSDKLFVLASLLCYLVVVYASWETFLNGMALREMSTRGYPLYWAYLIVPVGSASLAVRLIQDLVRSATGEILDANLSSG